MLAAAIADDAGVQAAIAAASERPPAEAAARAAPRPHTTSGVSLRSVRSTGSIAVRSSGRPVGGTRSTYGPQTLSSRRSGPSFSFGTGPARAPPALEVDLGMLRAGLLPAASVNTRASTPGPIYKPQPTRKRLGDGPRPSFGSQEQRPASLGGGGGGGVSRASGRSTLPGPGSYKLPGSVGPQALSRCKSNNAYSFGGAKQHTAAVRNTADPGPVYDVPQSATRRGVIVRATYSFGNEIRDRVSRLDRMPGPGTYQLPDAIGPQFSSASRSGAVISFGQPKITGESGRPVALAEGKHSPGPKYTLPKTLGKQAASGKRSSPYMAFTRAERFPGPRMSEIGTPGPGDYVV